ncbi:predicted protein [Streptomyces viridosporus ATCC 14672]|uniref:Uncharacterized protein n=2 Tax=Streptomyces viridosporus TaxID=67581 RepID=A0ABX6AHF2_STRVD|nr:predicted protein [Streptomyces viridosporus ATCC 14672]QEU86469.1 hypothetical protein CP969_18550 [Streptomyces viridosporus T7A]
MLRRRERGPPDACTRDRRGDRQVYRRLGTVRSAYAGLDRPVSGAGAPVAARRGGAGPAPVPSTAGGRPAA